MTVVIDGREYMLTQRRAFDVLELSLAAEKQEEPDSMMKLLIAAHVVVDSLKATRARLGWLRGWRYRCFMQAGATQVIIEALSVEEINVAVEKIGELEGVKKKAQ